MAKRASIYRSKARPWLTTEEIMELTGVTRRTLLTLEERGVVEPHHFNERGGVLGWTFAQAQTIRRAQLMRSQGMPFDELGHLAEEGDFEQLSAAFTMEIERERRRGLKRTLLAERQTADLESCKDLESPYLRYIPQRWLAAVRCEGLLEIGSDAYVSARILLADVAQHIGWCATDTGGIIRGIDGGNDTFVYTELASQPTTRPKAGLHADGGCYHSFGGSCAFEGTDVDCALCPRFGAATTDGDRIRWADRCTEIGALPLPSDYAVPPEGPWGDINRRLDLNASAVDRIADTEQIVAARPTLMPLETDLPVGIVAAVLPASTWLCMRSAKSSQEATAAQANMVAHIMKTTALTTERAQEVCSALEGKLRENGRYWRMTHGDECMGPLTGLPLVADPDLAGWCRSIDLSQVHRLTSPTMTGLVPGDERIAVISELTCELDEYEYELLVDMDALPKDLAVFKTKKKRGHGLFALGATPRTIVSTDKPEQVSTMCRECKASFEHDADLQVAVCPSCGAAKVIGSSRNKRARAFAAEAETELADGNFENAVKLAERAIKCDKDFADAYWMRALGRHEISYHPATHSDSRFVRIGKPGEESFVADEDFRAAIEKAGIAQWTTYSYQLNALERARKLAQGNETAEVRVSR